MEGLREGCEAIADRLKELYPNQEGIYYGTAVPYFMGGKDPLDGVEIYESRKGEPHWHYVTYGFSELYDESEDENIEEVNEEENEKDDEEQRVSGYGFELTFRLKKTTEEAPVWPVNLLQNLARYVFSSGNVFDSGHHLDCNGPVALETDTKLCALGFLADEELGEIDTISGHVKFIQAVAITHDEMEGIMCWNGEAFLKELQKKIPFGITNLDRNSLMENTEFYEIWKQGMERDGSSTAFLYMNDFDCRMEQGQIQMRLGAGHVRTFVSMLRNRVGKGRELYIQTEKAEFYFKPSRENGYGREEEEFCVILLTQGAVAQIAETLKPNKGEYLCKELSLKFVISSTEIKDSEGKVIEIIE